MLYRTIQQHDTLLATLKSSLCYTEPFNRTIRYWQPWNSSIKKINIRGAWGYDLKRRDHVFQFNGLISQSDRTAGTRIGTFDSEEIYDNDGHTKIFLWLNHIDSDMIRTYNFKIHMMAYVALKASLCYTEPLNITIRYWQPWNVAYVIQKHSTQPYSTTQPAQLS